MSMENKKLNTENTEENGLHRKFLSVNSYSVQENKWGKENNKFFGDFGSIPCNPCTKSEDQLNEYPQDKQDPNPRIS
jgi:hypothetical protein